jgi:general secretion pathway protein I
MTVAALLLRSKMIDIEKHLFHDGFTLNTEEDDGDFGDEDHPEIKWRSRISEVRLDLSALTSICGMAAQLGSAAPGGAGGKATSDPDASVDAQSACEAQITTMGQMLGPYIEELGRSMRAVELMVTWPEGRFEEHMSVRTLLTRDDFGTEQETDAARLQNQLGGAAGVGGTGAGAPTGGASPGRVQ